jgi:signal transduction histidine kinase
MIVPRAREVELHENAAHVLLDGSRGDEERACDAGIRTTLGHQRENFALPGAEDVERVAHVAGGDELAHEHGIDDRTAAYDPLERVDEVVDVGDATLQDVAATRAAGEEVGRLLDVDVCGQQHDRSVGQLLTDRACRLETFVGVVRRHPDVDDRKVGTLVADEGDQLRRSTALTDDHETGALEQARQTFAEQDFVIGEDDPSFARGHNHDYGLRSPCGHADAVGATTRVNDRVNGREDARLLAEEHEALRRVATVVATGAAPSEVFEAVCTEIAGLIPADGAALTRIESDDTATVLGFWSTRTGYVLDGRRYPIAPGTLVRLIVDTRKPARVDDYSDVPGSLARVVRQMGWRSAVGAPIVVDGRLWGLVGVNATSDRGLPPETEARLAQFTELMATAVANAQSREEIARLAAQESSLHRVARLVAGGAPPVEVFAAVAHEVAQVMHLPIVTVARFDGDGDGHGDGGMVTVVAEWSDRPHAFRLGTSWAVFDGSMAQQVRTTGRPASVDDYTGFDASLTESHRSSGIRSTVGAPIIVDGRVWGVMAAALSAAPPDDLEDRLREFTELVATAIANGQARADLEGMAEQQAALRRVATLVAEGAPQPEVFEAVCTEVGRVVAAEGSGLARFGADGAMVDLGRWTADGGYVALSPRSGLQVEEAAMVVLDTGRPVRIPDFDVARGAGIAEMRALGFRSSILVPIVVNGRIWGAAGVATKKRDTFPPDTEARVAKFTDLAALAIANAESRAELAVSRARLVTTADATRRRIERDLHDGAQQGLVSLAMELRAAQATMPRGLDELERKLSHVVAGLARVMDELREIAHGIHPAILAQSGLAAALRSLARRSPVPVDLHVADETRLPEHVQVAAYYVVAEALSNTAKHAQASVARVNVAGDGRVVRIEVRDDGRGGADPALGSGLLGLKDRAEAIGGTLILQSPPGEGTSVEVALPLDGYWQHPSQGVSANVVV